MGTLSPAYDVNPVATGGGLALNISKEDNSQDLDLVLSIAPTKIAPATPQQLNSSRGRLPAGVAASSHSWQRWTEVFFTDASRQDLLKAELFGGATVDLVAVGRAYRQIRVIFTRPEFDLRPCNR
jgi:hypothetical protein